MKLSEAKKIIEIIKVTNAKIDMVNPILEMVDETPETKAEIKNPEPVKTEQPDKVKRVYNFKVKSCEKCGQKFTPHYGAQKLCDECKDIQDTANDLLEIEE